MLRRSLVHLHYRQNLAPLRDGRIKDITIQKLRTINADTPAATLSSSDGSVSMSGINIPMNFEVIIKGNLYRIHVNAEIYFFGLTGSAQGLDNNLSDEGFGSHFRGISRGF